MKIIDIFFVLITIIVICIGCHFSSNKTDYEKYLVPFQSEINNFENYEKATELILKNWERLQKENGNTRGIYGSYSYSLADSIIMIQKDSLNLRFIAYPMRTEIEKNDTTIVFNPSSSDYKMISNYFYNEHESPYIIFRHSVMYTTKPIEVSEAITKIKTNYYYIIDSFEEY